MGIIKTLSKSIVLAAGVACAVSAGTVEEPFEVGTWGNFCQGAVSHTFDDNTGNQLSTGVPLFNEYGFHMTIFSSTAFSPNWSGLKSAFEEGHEIGSHGVAHGNPSPSSEFAPSQQTVQQNTGDPCVSYAYPNCTSPDQTATNYYVAARNCDGYPNAATPDNFNEIKSQITGTTQYGGINGAQAMNNLVDAAASANGWCVYLHHGIDGDHNFASTSSSDLRSNLDYLDQNRGKVWCETFGNVARYIKERDAANLTVEASDDYSYTLSLTDDLDDETYNYPLSIRIPIEDDWDSPTIQQAGEDIEDSVITFDGTEYLMFKAVPDGGDIVIQTGAKTSVKNNVGLIGNTTPISRQGSVLKINRSLFNSQVSVTLFNLAGKVVIHRTLTNAESTISLNDINLNRSAFIAKISDGATTYSHLFTPEM